MRRFWLSLALLAAVTLAGAVDLTAPAPSVGALPHRQASPAWLNDANLSCGIPPIPPVGCKVGACQCDTTGRNCAWQMICN